MNTRQGMFGLWIVVSGLWLVGDGIIWYQDFEAEQAQIAALDECGKIYPPVPDGFVLDKPNPYEQYAPNWKADEAKLHPNCVPNVDTVSFTEFFATHASDREEMHLA